MKNTPIIVIFLLLVSCNQFANNKSDKKIDYNEKLSQFEGVNNSGEKHFLLRDTINIRSLGLIIVSFIDTICDEKHWNEGYLIFDSVTQNAYVISYHKPSSNAHCWSNKEEYERKLNDQASRYTLLKDEFKKQTINDSINIYKEDYIDPFLSEINCYLNNCSFDTKSKLNNANLDSLFRLFVFKKLYKVKADLITDTTTIERIADSGFRYNYIWSHPPFDFPEKANEAYKKAFLNYLKENFYNGNVLVYRLGTNIIYAIVLNDQYKDFHKARELAKKIFNNGINYSINIYYLHKLSRKELSEKVGSMNFD